MYRDYHAFSTPDDNQIIWKYMDFTKFVSLLDKQALFFPTIKTLRHADTWEGTWSNFEFSEVVSSDTSAENIQRLKDLFFSVSSEIASQQIAVSCWFMNDHESTGMWRSYITGREGIAIQTTFGQLKNCLEVERKDYPRLADRFLGKPIEINAGVIEYVDWDHPPQNENSKKQFMYKAKWFDYERELRLMAKLAGVIGGADFNLGSGMTYEETLTLSQDVFEQVKNTGGVYIPVDLETLITNVFVVPTAQTWFVELVESVLQKYGINRKPRCSNQKPKY
jgi:hypothetical protein